MGGGNISLSCNLSIAPDPALVVVTSLYTARLGGLLLIWANPEHGWKSGRVCSECLWLPEACVLSCQALAWEHDHLSTTSLREPECYDPAVKACVSQIR